MGPDSFESIYQSFFVGLSEDIRGSGIDAHSQNGLLDGLGSLSQSSQYCRPDRVNQLIP